MWEHLRHSKLAQAGTALVILGGLAEALDQVGALDLSSVPYVGKYAPVIIACAGVSKIIVRLAIVLITGLSATKEAP